MKAENAMNTLAIPRPLSSGDVTRPLLAGSIGQLTIWYQRARQRRQLAGLSDRQLADIGVSRRAAAAEAAKPFWRE